MLALSRVDLGTTDLAALRAALRIPEGYQARQVTMDVEIGVEGQATEKAAFVLEPVASVAGIPSEARLGTQTLVFRLPDSAIRQFKALRDRIKAAKAEQRKGRLSIALNPDLCAVEAPPKTSMVFSTYLQTVETQHFIPVLLEFDAMSRPEIAEKMRTMPKC